MNNKDLLGKNSYPAIVEKIFEKIKEAETDTIAGNQLVKELYSKLNESATPMLEVRQFITNAEKVSNDDASLKDVVDFCKKSATKGDLNYIINICKEEHFMNMTRSGHPNPEETIKSIKEKFDEPGSIIEQGIRNGIFDCLSSNLLNNVKVSLGITEENIDKTIDASKDERGNSSENLNESIVPDDNSNTYPSNKDDKQKLDLQNLDEAYQYLMNGFCKYTPIGIITEDKQNNRMVILTESDTLSFDKSKQEFSKITDYTPDNTTKRLFEALNEVSYDPEKEYFTLNENWDFDLRLTNEGKCFISPKNVVRLKEIDSNNLQKLLLESINAYNLTSESKKSFIRDADNIICLMENCDVIYKLDKLRVLRNLNENSYVMFDLHDVKSTNTPNILSVNGLKSEFHKSFGSLCESVNNTIKFDCKKLFESELIAETHQLNERQSKVTSLMEEQKILNEQITKVTNLKKLAEDNSPAMDKLNEQENMLRNKLDNNIKDLNFYQNEFELH